MSFTPTKVRTNVLYYGFEKGRQYAPKPECSTLPRAKWSVSTSSIKHIPRLAILPRTQHKPSCETNRILSLGRLWRLSVGSAWYVNRIRCTTKGTLNRKVNTGFFVVNYISAQIWNKRWIDFVLGMGTMALTIVITNISLSKHHCPLSTPQCTPRMRLLAKSPRSSATIDTRKHPVRLWMFSKNKAFKKLFEWCICNTIRIYLSERLSDHILLESKGEVRIEKARITPINKWVVYTHTAIQSEERSTITMREGEALAFANSVCI